jgi:hypothetical protein
MNSSGGGTGTSHALTASSSSSPYQYLPAKRSQNSQPASSLSTTDLRELTHTLQELNNNFKRNITVLTEIKDYIIKVCEKQDSRPVDDNSGVHKLERVRFLFRITFFKKMNERKVFADCMICFI